MLALAEELSAAVVLKGHTNSIECCAFHPKKDELLLTGSHDHTIKTWDVNKGTCLSTLEAHKAGVWSLQFSNDGKRVLTASPDKTVKIWDISGKDAKNVATLEGHSNNVYWAKFNEQNTLVASGGSGSELIIWDLRKGTQLTKITNSADIIYSVDFSKDDKLMFATDSDGSLYVYETVDFDCIRIEKRTSRAFALSADWSKESKINDGIFVAYEDKFSRLWKYDGVRNSLELTKEYGPHSDQVKNNVYHGKSNTLVTCCRDGSAKIWDSNSGALVYNLVGHTDTVACAAFNYSDPQLIATGAWDQSAMIYKIPKK